MRIVKYMFCKTLNIFPQLLLLKRAMVPLWILLCLLLANGTVLAQEKPPKPITVAVTTQRNLNFGTIVQNPSGGTVTVDYSGIRTASDPLLIPSISSSSVPTSVQFEVTALPGTLITILNGPQSTLTGGIPAGSMTMNLGNSNFGISGTSFVAQSSLTYVTIGGTLSVGAAGANPPGIYSGFFTVTFIQQ